MAQGRFPFSTKQPAPSLAGGADWLNTPGPIDLAELRGKFVLLDFWTYCCINCMHILPELKKLEQAYPKNLVVIGVHSGKFAGEKDIENIRQAVLRYEVEHPVVNDPEYLLWNRFGVSVWPSLRLIDPEGNLVGGLQGEVEFDQLQRVLKGALPYYRRKGVLDETPLEFNLERHQAVQTPLRFPGKVLADPEGERLFIADSGHNRIVVAGLDGELLEVIGSGAAGSADGGYDKAQFNDPQGMALRGDTLYVADTKNHLLRKIDLDRKQVTTIAGTGKQRRDPRPPVRRSLGSPRRVALASPWDLCIVGDQLYIAMAGPHQIWSMTLDERQIGVYAGSGREDIVDGPLLPRNSSQQGTASFAQPSGLASDGKWLYVADSEGSSIRAVPLEPGRPVVTLVGTAHLAAQRLFVFGDVDGEHPYARLQHPLGLAYHEGVLYIADTYNDKIKRLDPNQRSVQSIAGSSAGGFDDEPALIARPALFDEPGGLSAAGGSLYVADTNNHRIAVIDLEGGYRVSTLDIAGLDPPDLSRPAAKPAFPGADYLRLEPVAVRPVDERLKISIRLELPPGHKLNELVPMRHWIETEGASGPLERSSLERITRIDPPREAIELDLPLRAAAGEALLQLALTYYYCEQAGSGLCKVGSVIWTVPLRISPDADARSLQLAYSIE